MKHDRWWSDTGWNPAPTCRPAAAAAPGGYAQPPPAPCSGGAGNAKPAVWRSMAGRLHMTAAWAHQFCAPIRCVRPAAAAQDPACPALPPCRPTSRSSASLRSLAVHQRQHNRPNRHLQLLQHWPQLAAFLAEHVTQPHALGAAGLCRGSRGQSARVSARDRMWQANTWQNWECAADRSVGSGSAHWQCAASGGAPPGAGQRGPAPNSPSANSAPRDPQQAQPGMRAQATHVPT